MKLIESLTEMQSWALKNRLEGKSIGFVPTMGFLHEGHLSLLRVSKQENELTVLSIYVNPTQFGPREDFSKYPRDIEKDLELADDTGVDVVFIPADEQMYPKGYQTYVIPEELSLILEGKSRPGHFRGVCTIVLKLLNLVQPYVLYLGQKDAQQCVVLTRMAKELNLPVKISIQPTIRESDGLAMSSRNSYLNPEERKAAIVLYKSLQLAKSQIEQGNKQPGQILHQMELLIKNEKLAKIDYIAIVNPMTLEDMKSLRYPVLICLAVYFGKTRLIDNIWLTASPSKT